MATASRSRARSGGKMPQPRRGARITTPYDRPPNTNLRAENPSWISKLILSPTRVIVSGAGKLLSSVFGSESSSSSSSGSGSISDDEIEDNNGNDTSSPTLDAPDKDKEKSEAARHLTKEAKQAAVLNKTKLLIEQLLLQETFSWEECEKLTNIIKSRVMVAPVSYREAGRQSEVYGAALKDAEMPHLSTALMEANKWIKEKKSGSIPELDLDPIVLSHVNEGEIGSPVDLAKSFMKDSRPSASPCFTSKAERTTSPIGIQLFEDDELSSRGGNPVSSSKVQRDAPIIGLWNISEEIRRVRSKATEQLLSTPSTKNDLSASKPRSSASKFERSGLVMENMYSMNSSAPNIVEDGLRGGVLTSARVNQLEKEEPLLLNPPVLLSEQDKDLDGKMMNGVRNDETIVISDSVDVVDGVTNRDTNGNEMNESYLSLPCAQISDSLPKEVSGTGDASLQNGLLHSSTRMSGEELDVQTFNEELNPPTSSLPTAEPKEAPINEVPDANPNDGIVIGSQDSYSMQYDELPEESQQGQRQAGPPKRGRKVTRLGRKRRGRGK